jgi:hypothetical protein
MLHGFSVPLTPQGKSPLASPPPWHYSSDCLVIEYWADPAAIAALLPPGVTPDEKSSGRAFFWFLDWQFTASNDEITDPDLGRPLDRPPHPMRGWKWDVVSRQYRFCPHSGNPTVFAAPLLCDAP